jgi:hypothetical protein
MNKRDDSRHVGRLVFGAILLGIGALLLVGQLANFQLADFSWPLIFPAIGLMFFLGMVLGGRQAGGLAVPGSIMVMLGLIFFYQNATGHWESWAYVWALIPLSVGGGIVIQGFWSAEPEAGRDGVWMIGIGLVMFLLGLAFFETVIFKRAPFGAFTKYIAPVTLIALGALILGMNLFGRGRGLVNRSSDRDVPPPE